MEQPLPGLACSSTAVAERGDAQEPPDPELGGVASRLLAPRAERDAVAGAVGTSSEESVEAIRENPGEGVQGSQTGDENSDLSLAGDRNMRQVVRPD